MSTLETLQKLIAAEFEIDPAELDPARPLQELGIDSLAMTECLFKIEDEFKISISGSSLQVGTLQEIADLVDSHLKAQSSGAA